MESDNLNYSTLKMKAQQSF